MLSRHKVSLRTVTNVGSADWLSHLIASQRIGFEYLTQVDLYFFIFRIPGVASIVDRNLKLAVPI